MPDRRNRIGWRLGVCAAAVLCAGSLANAEQPPAAPATEQPAAGQPGDGKQPDADSTPDPEARRVALLADRDRLEREARQHQAAGSLAAAIASAEKMLVAEREALSPDHDDVNASLRWLAELSAWKRDTAAARKYSEQSLANQTRLHGEDGWNTATSRQLLKYVERVAELDEAQLKQLIATSGDYQKAIDLRREGKLPAALDSAKRVAPAFQALLGDEQSATAHSLLLVGFLQTSLGQSDEAALALTKATQMYRQGLGTAHPDTARCLAALGDAERNRGKFDSAVAAYREAADIRQQLFGPDNDETRASLASLASTLGQAAYWSEERDKLAAAKTARQEALAIWSRLYPQDDWRVSNARGWLSRVEQLAGLTAPARKQLATARQAYAQCSQLYDARKYDEAVAPGQQAIDLRREILGADSTDTASAINLLGLVMAARHDLPRSEALLAEAIEIWRKLRGDGHPEFALVVQNLAEVYEDNGKLDQAQQLMRQALEIRQRTYGQSDSDTIRSATRLANLLGTIAGKLAADGDFAAAKLLRADVVALRTQVVGADHWQTLEARWLLNFAELQLALSPEQRQKLKDADAMSAQAEQFATPKQWAPAVAAMEEAASLRKDVYGARHLLYGLTLSRSASLNESQGSYARAAELYGQVRDIVKTELGADHPLYVTTISNLAGVLLEQKNFAAAAELYREAWQTRSREFGSENTDALDSAKKLLEALGRLAAIQDAKPDPAGAKKSRQEVVAVLTQLYGEKNWQVNDARWALYQTEQMPTWRGGQRQQLTQADSLLGQASQAHQRLAEMDKQFPRPTAEQKASVAQPGVQAATQAVALRKQVLGEAHPSVADALEWLAVVQRDQGSDSAAQTSYEQALAIRKKSQGTSHPSYAKTRGSLGRTMAAALALPFQRPSKLTPAQQQRIAQRDWYDNQAKRQKIQGDAQGAYRSTQSMLQIEREVYGEFHEESASSYDQLAELAWSMGRTAESRQHRARLIEIHTKLHGADSWQVREARYYVDFFDRFLRLNQEQMRRLVDAEQLPAKLMKLDRDKLPPDKMADAVLSNSDVAIQVLRDILGEDNIFVANCLQGKALAYDRKDQAEQAENALWQAAEITGRALGKKHPLYFSRLSDLAQRAFYAAQTQESNGNFAEAQKLWAKRIVIQTLHYGSDHWRVRDARFRLAYCQQLEKFSGPQRKELALAQRGIYTPGVPQPPMMVGDEREKFDGQQRYQAFRKLFGEDSPDTIARLHELALERRTAGEVDKALPLLRQVLELRRRVQGSDHPDTARTANDLGVTYFRVGAYVDAEPLLREACQTLEKLGKSHLPTYAASLNNLAVVYQALGDYDRAEPLLREVVNIRVPLIEASEDGPDNDEQTSAGKYEALTGEFNVAAAFERDKEQFVTARPPREIDLSELGQYLNNLALLYQKRGDYKQAEPLLRQSLGVIRSRDSKEYAIALGNLAVLYQAQGNLDRAELLLERVIQIRQELSKFDPKYATALNNLGVVCLRRGDLERTGELWREALEQRRKLLGEGNPNTLISMANVALLADRTGHPAEAAQQLDQVLERASANLRLATAIQSERQQLILRQALRGYLDHYLSLSTRAQLPAESVYRHVLAWKGAVAADQRRLREYRQLSRAKGNEEIAKLYASLEETTRKLAAMTFGGTGDNELSHKQFDALGVQKDDLERELAKRSKQSGRRTSEPLTVAQLKELLPPKTALVDLIEYSHITQPVQTGPTDKRAEVSRQTRLLAFVIRKDRPVAIHELGPADKIEKLVDGCRELWLRGKRTAGRDPAAELRAAIWEPLVADLSGAETVLVAPDGATARVPLAALPGKEPDTYLIEELAIAVVPAPQLLAELLSATAPRSGAAPKMLLVGNVDFGADPGTEPSQRRGGAAPRGGKPANFGELPATLSEVKAVEQLYRAKYKQGVASLLEQAAATESAVRKQAVAAKYLHLATHGFFAPAELKSAEAASSDPLAGEAENEGEQTSGWNPGLLSGVVLAGVNRPLDGSHDDGILTAAEVADMNLAATQLVVLSACETGLGQMAGGEGALGLQRAFHVAGARTVLASLWKVDDRATQLLMTQFYDNLWSKDLPPLAAFRAAQLSLLNGTVDVSGLRGLEVADEQPDDGAAGKRLSPRLWAAFVLSGSPN